MVDGSRGTARVQQFLRRCLSWGEAPHVGQRRQPTGLPQIDAALGGGLPSGRIALIQGGLGAGKTSLCLTLVAQAQKRQQAAAWLDLDHTLQAARATACGVDASTLVAQCTDACRALTMATALLVGGHATWLVIDPWPPLEGPQATRQALRALARAAAETAAVVLITQPWLDSDAEAHPSKSHNELIYIASTSLTLGMPTAAQSRRIASCEHWATRIEVTKRAGLPCPNRAPMCTFIVPFSGGSRLPGGRHGK